MSQESTGQAEGQLIGSVLGPNLRLSKGNRITLDLSPEAIDVLSQLLNQTHDRPDDLFRKALALYKIAQDAHREGKAVGFASSPDALETEFVGF
jgi:hypothetical protein